jgi:hypothetical protein
MILSPRRASVEGLDTNSSLRRDRLSPCPPCRARHRARSVALELAEFAAPTDLAYLASVEPVILH